MYEEAREALGEVSRPKKKPKVVVACVKAACDPELDLGPEYEAWCSTGKKSTQVEVP
jgi:hypothetical protein